ncbi:MAG TPA: alpha/beta hydrolase [Noviherbaspirillum sp.]|jgi:pimeloyl-ACP methyl ester carboxylesterase|uniref:alpha/beta fold hydrolase n=1 Tax=Noviherbaspirillum sp. TaxID=1926288 RepID=UPI002F94C5DF
MAFPERDEGHYYQAAYAEPPRRRRAAGWLLVAGVALAASAYVVRERTRKAEGENPPVGQFIEVNGIRLHYMERGEGQPLVMLHGDGSMIQDFMASGLVDMAAQKYRVIVFDRPGYGYSGRPRSTIWTPQAQATLLQQALLQLGVEQPVVLGHSWGTLVAIALALDFPERVRSLVLASGYYYPSLRMDVPLVSGPAIPVVGDLMRYTVSPLVGRATWPALRRKVFSPAEAPERFMREFPVEMALRPSQLRASAAEAAIMIPAVMALRHRYHELVLPVAILAGDGDRIVSTGAQSERLHGELPQSSLHITHGAGHMLHHVAPMEVMAAIDHMATAVGAMPQAALAIGQVQAAEARTR